MMATVKTITLRTLRRLASPVLRQWYASQARILTYHRFPADRQNLINQCRHIRDRYTPVSLATICSAIRDGKSLPPQALTVTVDDGYRDFYSNAHPVFAEFGIPVTVFLVSNFLDGRQWLWWNELEYAFQRTARDMVQWEGRQYSLLSRELQSAALDVITEGLKALPNAMRIAQHQQLLTWLGVDLPKVPPMEYAPLRWDEVRELAATGVEFGGHSHTHPILSRVESDADLRHEIAGCKTRIEQELQRSVTFFCYPNGRLQDVGTRVEAITSESGYHAAVTTNPGMNTKTEDLLRLRRLSVEPDFPAHYFEELLAGLRKG